MKKFSNPRLMLIASMTIFGTLGLVLITGIGDVGGGNDFIGILFGLGAAVFYATVILLNKFIKNVEGIHRTFLQFLSAIFTLIPYVLMTSGITLRTLNSIGWLNLLIVGLIHTGVTYCMYFSSLKELPGQTVAMLSYIDPLVAVLVSVTILEGTNDLLASARWCFNPWFYTLERNLPRTQNLRTF